MRRPSGIYHFRFRRVHSQEKVGDNQITDPPLASRVKHTPVPTNRNASVSKIPNTATHLKILERKGIRHTQGIIVTKEATTHTFFLAQSRPYATRHTTRSTAKTQHTHAHAGKRIDLPNDVYKVSISVSISRIVHWEWESDERVVYGTQFRTKVAGLCDSASPPISGVGGGAVRIYYIPFRQRRCPSRIGL